MSILRGQIIAFDSPPQFQQFRQHSCHAQTPVCSVWASCGKGDSAFVRIVASKRNIGGAVQRNRAKRRLRAALRKIWDPQKPLNMVLYARKSVLDAPFEQIVKNLQEGLGHALGADWSD